MKGRDLIGIFIILASCTGSDFPDTNGMPHPPIDLTDCQLTRIAFTGGAVVGHFGDPVYTYTYDSDNKVIATDDQQHGMEGIRIRKWFTYEGDTIRSNHYEFGIHEGTEVQEKTDYMYFYQQHTLSRMEFVRNDTITGVKVFSRNVDGKITQITTTTATDTLSETYSYPDQTTLEYSNSDGLTYSYTFDTKINPEALLNVHLDDPIKSFPYNILTQSDGHSYVYTYDVSGEPLSRVVYQNGTKTHSDEYHYLCP